jgi:subtilisin family serine protease
MSRSRSRSVMLFAVTLWACGDLPSTMPVPNAASTAAGGPFALAPDPAEVVAGQYIVTFDRSVSDPAGLATALAAQHGGRVGYVYSAALKGFSVSLNDAAVAALARNPQIARIERDAVVRGTDVQVSPTWGLDRIDQHALPLDRSYGYTNDGAGVSVYIIDSGIRTTHREFSGRATGAFTAISDGRGAADCNGHGTHVSGTVGGVTYGVAKAVTLFAVRVLDCAGNGTTSGLIAGIDWVTQNRRLPAVANLSLATAKSATVNAAVQGSIDAGVVYAVAAGNNGGDACDYSPSSVSTVLTVGASGNNDAVQGFSNVGPCVDLFAPGQAIRSAYFVSDTSSVINAGTSMASPHVAGVAALYLSANPAATPAQVVSAITSTATSGVLTAVPAGTANRLLFADPTGASTSPPPPPPADTTTTPPPVTPPPDAPPTASFTKSCNRGKCTFDASASTDDKGVASYAWNFGDGTTASGGSSLVQVAHTFTTAGAYTVTLTITDSAGQIATKSLALFFKKL